MILSEDEKKSFLNLLNCDIASDDNSQLSQQSNEPLWKSPKTNLGFLKQTEADISRFLFVFSNNPVLLHNCIHVFI